MLMSCLPRNHHVTSLLSSLSLRSNSNQVPSFLFSSSITKISNNSCLLFNIMINYLAKYLLSKFFKLEYNLTIDDPYHDKIPINNAKTKFKSIPKKLPDNLSANDERILRKFKSRAFRYDMLFSFLGIPFGTANLFQFVPFVGSIYTTWQSVSLLLLTRQLTNGFPIDLLLYCVFNIVIDLLIGLIPIVGDLINIGFKANSRNYNILRKHLFVISDYNMGFVAKDQIRNNWFNNLFNWFKDKEEVLSLSPKFNSLSGKSSTSTFLNSEPVSIKQVSGVSSSSSSKTYIH